MCAMRQLESMYQQKPYARTASKISIHNASQPFRSHAPLHSQTLVCLPQYYNTVNHTHPHTCTHPHPYARTCGGASVLLWPPTGGLASSSGLGSTVGMPMPTPKAGGVGEAVIAAKGGLQPAGPSAIVAPRPSSTCGAATYTIAL